MTTSIDDDLDRSRSMTISIDIDRAALRRESRVGTSARLVSARRAVGAMGRDGDADDDVTARGGAEDDGGGAAAAAAAARARAAAATSCVRCRAARAVTYRYADGVKACAACAAPPVRGGGAQGERWRARRLCEACVGGDPALAEWFCAQDEVGENARAGHG